MRNKDGTPDKGAVLFFFTVKSSVEYHPFLLDIKNYAIKCELDGYPVPSAVTGKAP